MSRSFRTFFISALALWAAACGPERNFETRTLDSGRSIDVFFDGPFQDYPWLLAYRTRVGDPDEAMRELDEVWEHVRPRMEEAGLEEVYVRVVDSRALIPGWSSGPAVERSTALVYTRNGSDGWQQGASADCQCGE